MDGDAMQRTAMPTPVLCMLCGKPAVDSTDYDFKGHDGCCADAEWGYCKACGVWTERPANWSKEAAS